MKAQVKIKVNSIEFNFEQDEKGQWSETLVIKDKLFESEVIDMCKRSPDWNEIRSKHFPMEGFHA